MTPVGVCQRRSMMRGSFTPGGRRNAFFSRISKRGPMPARLRAAAKRGVSSSGRTPPKGVGPLASWLPLWPRPAAGAPACAFLFARAGLYQTRKPARWRRQSVASSSPAGLSKPIHMTDDVEARRRRAVYRAHHRGTKEMDWILGRFADAAVGALSADSLDMFERLLSLPDPDLQDMILHPELKPAGQFAGLVA